jgi:TolB-like protein
MFKSNQSPTEINNYTPSNEAIATQLQKILADSVFTHSDILSRFLSFIVHETLKGNSNWLKEYTIAIKVLNKPVNFRPQENGIVRIHAGRLRRALNYYYTEKGAYDPIRITVPKGSYVPVFSEGTIMTIVEQKNNTCEVPGNKSVLAVLPFYHTGNDILDDSLANGLGMQLSRALMERPNLSIVDYNTTNDLLEQTNNIKDIASQVGADYVITGDIFSINYRTRIIVQIIHINVNRQIWSKMYERNINSTNIYEIENEVTKLIVTELEELCYLMRISSDSSPAASA